MTVFDVRGIGGNLCDARGVAVRFDMHRARRFGIVQKRREDTVFD